MKLVTPDEMHITAQEQTIDFDAQCSVMVSLDAKLNGITPVAKGSIVRG